MRISLAVGLGLRLLSLGRVLATSGGVPPTDVATWTLPRYFLRPNLSWVFQECFAKYDVTTCLALLHASMVLIVVRIMVDRHQAWT